MSQKGHFFNKTLVRFNLFLHFCLLKFMIGLFSGGFHPLKRCTNLTNEILTNSLTNQLKAKCV